MAAQFSDLGQRFSRRGGIVELMDDLGSASAAGPMLMLGGGNPALIPEVAACWRRRLTELTTSGEIDRILGVYDPPQGNPATLASLAKFLRVNCGWDVAAENLAVMPGGQVGLFLLFNFLAGPRGGSARKILLPLMPEYIGYADQGLTEDLFVAQPPIVEQQPDGFFKYGIDFDHLPWGEDIAALCVSRPTNPTGNVLRDAEIHRLSELARQRGIPLIIDKAYGAPFPGILFTETHYRWEPHHIVSFSLSKLGLPGTRTSFLVASPEIIRALAAATAVMNLANGNLGQAIIRPMLEDASLLRLCGEIIRPFYQSKRDEALGLLRRAFQGQSPLELHQPEGGIFLWLRFPGLPISSAELYRRLKQRGLLIVPGHYFFFGLAEPHSHQEECIRLNFAQPTEVLVRGIAILAEEISRAYRS